MGGRDGERGREKERERERQRERVSQMGNRKKNGGLNRRTGAGMSEFVGCLTSQQQASVSQGRIYTDNFTCFQF